MIAIIDYTNWKGSRRLRRVIPQQIIFGSSEYHSGMQWMLLAYDVEDGEKLKTFAMGDIHSWRNE